MKRKNLIMTLLGLMFAAVITVSTSQSVFANDNFLKIQVPFEFYVGNEKMAPGTYEIRQTSGRTFVIRNSESKKGTTIVSLGQAVERKEAKLEKVVFRGYGNEYFLNSIYTRRGSAGHILVESSAESRARKNLKASKENNDKKEVKPDLVEVRAAMAR